MLTRKTRTLIATAAATLAVVVMPASSQALKSQPTGDKDLDDYCSKAAALIDNAFSQGDLALIDGHQEDAVAWYTLAMDMKNRSEANGCSFVSGRRVRRILRLLQTGAVQTSTELTVGTALEGGTAPRSVDTAATQFSTLAAP